MLTSRHDDIPEPNPSASTPGPVEPDEPDTDPSSGSDAVETALEALREQHARLTHVIELNSARKREAQAEINRARESLKRVERLLKAEQPRRRSK